jgi:hypothetical protein
MDVKDAQREIRSVYMGGFAGQLVSSVVWFLSAAAATLYRFNWFYPAFMIDLGTHYLPFMFLYGMWQFGPLAAILIGSGLAIGLYKPQVFSLGGWLTVGVLLAFAFIGRMVAMREKN